jgi:hypothetical protein
MGAITLMCIQAIITNVWFCVSNILLKNKELQMELLSHNVIFNVFVYILLKFEINLMNEKYPKTFKSIVINVFKQ